MTRQIEIPQLSLVILMGASASGKSTFARRHFLESEVLSSDRFRWMLADDENDQSATREAFESLHYIAEKRLARGKLVVVDATSVQVEARRPLIELAKRQDVLPIAIAINPHDRVVLERNARRDERNLPEGVIRRQIGELRNSLKGLAREGIRQVHVLDGDEADDVVIVRRPLWSDKRDERGPFDVIGDVHGCRSELEQLLAQLGYEQADGTYAHPRGRKVVFLGDLVDRGPDVPGCLEIAMRMVARGSALCVPGNHEVRLLRRLRGKDVKLTHGLAQTMEQLERHPPEVREAIANFIDGLISHYVLDGGRLVVAHAGMKETYQGRSSGRVREFALYGETTGEIDEYGLPVRSDWAAQYRGKAVVVYGHTPVLEAEWVNGTICIDTGCVFGGKLTALRWPERELVQVPAAQVYSEPIMAVGARAPSVNAELDALLDVGDVLSRLRVDTRLMGTLLIAEANVRAALEVMSRFAADPRWLVHLPPTMSPAMTSEREDLLEHPDEALAYYQQGGVARAICEEKHMGSRLIVVLARDDKAARKRFGMSGAVLAPGAPSAGAVLTPGAPPPGPEDERVERGACLTRTGRRFFEDRALEAALLDRIDRAMEKSKLWDELATDWVVLDAELMPWSAKARELVRSQYARVGAAGSTALGDAVAALERARAIGAPVAELAERTARRAAHLQRYIEAYRRYCWPVQSIDDLKIAPFHLLASEGKVHFDRDHGVHLGWLARLAETGDPLFVATRHRVVDLAEPSSVFAAVEFWEEITGAGGEGMVVKPYDFLVRGRAVRGTKARTDRDELLQPAIKCRGREYLRIIYGPEYLEHLPQLRSRGLARKRGLALRELALGMESLERFVRREPLRRVHECVLALVALESEPVDPRL